MHSPTGSSDLRPEPTLSALSGNQWCIERIGDGTLCWDNSPDPSARQAIDLLRSVVKGETDPLSLDILSDQGLHGDTYRASDLVLKRFKETRRSRLPDVSGLPYMKASVALHTGLIAVQPLLPESLKRRGDIHFTYAAPRMFAGFVPDEGNTSQQPLSVLSFAEGLDFWWSRLPRPDKRMRKAVYGLAIARVGLNPASVYLESGPGNTLFAQIDKRTVQVTQLDAEFRSIIPRLASNNFEQ
jgi:hypothetical protein